MTDALTWEDMSSGLFKGVERAQREPEGRCNSLAHLMDVPALARAYRRQRTDAAVGVDGVTKEQYGVPPTNAGKFTVRLYAPYFRYLQAGNPCLWLASH